VRGMLGYYYYSNLDDDMLCTMRCATTAKRTNVMNSITISATTSPEAFSPGRSKRRGELKTHIDSPTTSRRLRYVSRCVLKHPTQHYCKSVYFLCCAVILLSFFTDYNHRYVSYHERMMMTLLLVDNNRGHHRTWYP
jgi:hypothetical protein